MFRRIFASLAAAALPVALATPTGAELVIDSFVTQQVLSLGVGGQDALFSAVAAPEAIGGERDAQLDRLAGNNPTDLLVNGSGADELLSCSTSPNTTSAWLLVWDGPDGASGLDPDGLGGVDLTQGGVNLGLRFDAQSDLPATVTFEVTGASGGAADGQLILPGGDTMLIERFLPFSAFNSQTPFADAGSVSVAIEGGTGLDAQIGAIVATVPEPTGAAAPTAVAGALAALARRRHRARPPG